MDVSRREALVCAAAICGAGMMPIAAGTASARLPAPSAAGMPSRTAMIEELMGVADRLADRGLIAYAEIVRKEAARMHAILARRQRLA